MYRILIFISIIIVLSPTFGLAQEWQSISTTSGEHVFYHLLVDDFNPNALYAASKDALHFTNTGGKQWQTIFRTEHETNTIECVFAQPLPSTIIYIGTTHTLYAYDSKNNNITKLFSVSSNDEALTSCTINPFNPDEIIIGTSHGLYFSTDNGNTWKKPYGIPREHVIACAFHPNIQQLFFIATNHGIYLSHTFPFHFYKTYVLLSSDEQTNPSFKNAFYFDPTRDEHINVLYNGTVYESTNTGETWALHPSFKSHI